MSLDVEYIESLYISGKLRSICETIIFIEIVQYQYEQNEKGLQLSEKDARSYIQENKIMKYINLDYCLSQTSNLVHYSTQDLYIRDLQFKKLKYFKSLIKFQQYQEIYDLLININWHVFEIDNYENWKSFIDKLTEYKDWEIKNTRPISGFKPNKISSKIIYGRNGKN